MSRVALLGTGRIGTHHAEVLAREVPGLELVALVDPAVERARELGAIFGVPTVLDDYRRLEEVEGLDAVVITTPAATHLDLIEHFAASGLHIFTEKPLATTVADADRAAAAVAGTDLVLQVGFNRRFAESW